MKLLINEKFINELPKGEEKKILNKVKQFVDELDKKGIKGVSNGFNPRKVAGNYKKYKFRIDDGSRVIFMYGKDVDGIENIDCKDCLIILHYCCHDNQIRIAKEQSADIESLELLPEKEDELDIFINYSYKDYYYNFEEHMTRIISHTNIDKILDEYSIYYLNDEQRECLKKATPLMVFGSAGSGKTIISINKMYNLYKDYDKNIAYFTYSKDLLKRSELYFNQMCKEFGYNENNNYHFYDTNNYLLMNCNEVSLVKYREFEKWYNIKAGKKSNYSSLQVWKEIRGIIKGMIGVEWEIKSKIKINVISKYTHVFLKKNKFINEDNKKNEFHLTEDINIIKKRTEVFDGDREKVEKDLNKIYYILESEICDKTILDKDTYLELPTTFSTIEEGDRTEVYDIAVKYEAWKNKNERLDENDLARANLRKVLKGEIEKYDFILVDEIQDLTEIQVYFLFRLVKNPQDIFLCGDYNQTINPTYFDTHRIITLLKKKYNKELDINKSLVNLSLNYRNSKGIVNLSKRLTELRKEKLWEHKKNYYDEIPFKNNTQKPFLLKPNDFNKSNLFNTALGRHYVSIVVCDENEKEDFEKNFNVKNRVFTVSDMKGLENDYVICYNIISKYKDKWKDIFDLNYNKGGNKTYSYYFNMLYVSITRAKNNICIYEENINDELLKYIYEFVEEIEVYDDEKMYLNEESQSIDFYRHGLELEEKEKYNQAIEQYKLSGLDNCLKNIKRCRAKIKQDEGNFKEAADIYFEIEEYNLAKSAYYMCNEEQKHIESLILSSDNYENILSVLNENPVKILKKYNNLNRKVIPKFSELYYEYNYLNICERYDKLINDIKFEIKKMI